jgi:hypothetical protein
MPFKLSDSTSGTQRFAVDNSQHTELGSATPSSELSVNGHSILNGAVLAATVAAPVSMARTTGGLSLAAGATATINVPATTSAFSSINGPGNVVSYNSAKTQMTVACTLSTGTGTLTYGNF